MLQLPVTPTQLVTICADEIPTVATIKTAKSHTADTLVLIMAASPCYLIFWVTKTHPATVELEPKRWLDNWARGPMELDLDLSCRGFRQLGSRGAAEDVRSQTQELGGFYIGCASVATRKLCHRLAPD